MATRGRRASSVGRVEPRDEVLGEIAHALRDLRLTRPADRREQFKAPEFNGDGDVELFIQHFNEVALANDWNQLATLLHLREALKEGARECGRPDQVAAIFELLRSRYGLTAREARNRLSSLKKDVWCSLHDHATMVEKLVRRAYEELPLAVQENMMLDMFCSTLGNATLQRHLLAMRPNTMMEAVQHGNEYFQVRPDKMPTDSKVRNLDEPEDDEVDDRVAPTSHDVMASLLKAMEQLTAQVAKLQQGPPKKDTAQKCWGCKQPGHTRSECTTHPWTKQKSSTQAGNGDSPQ